MSNFWFNIRFGVYHWQWGPDGVKWNRNPAQETLRNEDPNWKRFEVYTAFGKQF